MESPQPEKNRVANVTIAKSRVLAAQVLSHTWKERPVLLGVKGNIWRAESILDWTGIAPGLGF
jgi:hypothetical protein